MRAKNVNGKRLVLMCSLIVGAMLNFANLNFAWADATRPNGDLLIEPSDAEAVPMASTQTGQSSAVQLIVQNLDRAAKTSMVGTILNPHVKFLGAHYPGRGGTCAKELGLNQSCTLVLEFAPKTPGLKRALIRMNYWSGPRPETSYRVLEGATI